MSILNFTAEDAKRLVKEFHEGKPYQEEKQVEEPGHRKKRFWSSSYEVRQQILLEDVLLDCKNSASRGKEYCGFTNTQKVYLDEETITKIRRLGFITSTNRSFDYEDDWWYFEWGANPYYANQANERNSFRWPEQPSYS